VLVDGRPLSSCTTPAFEIDGKSLLTIEGLADGDRLHPIQQAFWQEGGFECGFCTPGMILSVYSLLSENPNPTDDEIKHRLASNMCRCTGYVSILAAVKRAAELMRSNETATLAKHGLRLDGRERFAATDHTADLQRPGMLYAKISQSDAPATIKKIRRRQSWRRSSPCSRVMISRALILTGPLIKTRRS
jgi:xanthine dehydrogenase iron-sulfur cluster and FAD-binding subunit A